MQEPHKNKENKEHPPNFFEESFESASQTVCQVTNSQSEHVKSIEIITVLCTIEKRQCKHIKRNKYKHVKNN